MELEDIFGRIFSVSFDTSASKRDLAADSGADPSTLNVLSKDTNHWIRATVAVNKATPLNALIRLTKDPSFYVRYALLWNDSITHQVLAELKLDQDACIRLLAHSKLSQVDGLCERDKELLLKTGESLGEADKIYLAGMSSDTALLDLLLGPKMGTAAINGISAALARNPNTPERLIVKMLESEWTMTDAVLSSNSTHAHISHLINYDFPYHSTDQVRRQNLEQEQLRLLSGHRINERIQFKLADSFFEEVRYKLATMPGTAREVQEKLARDQDKDIRFALSQNPSVSPEILFVLQFDSAELVRQGCAQNPSATSDILENLTRDQSEFVKAAVASNPSTPLEILIRLNDNLTSEGLALALNKNQKFKLHQSTLTGDLGDPVIEQVRNKVNGKTGENIEETGWEERTDYSTGSDYSAVFAVLIIWFIPTLGAWIAFKLDAPLMGCLFILIGVFFTYKLAKVKPSNDDDDDHSGKSSRMKIRTGALLTGALGLGYLAGKKTKF